MPGINNDTKLLNSLIKKHGSVALAEGLIDPNEIASSDLAEIVSELSLDDRLRLFSILLTEQTDPERVRQILNNVTINYRFFKVAIEHGFVDPNIGRILLTNVALTPNGSEIVSKLLADGVDPNFEIDLQNFRLFFPPDLWNALPQQVSFVQSLELISSLPIGEHFPDLVQIIQLLKEHGAH